MPAPSTYTEEELAAFMVSDLSEVGQVLGWSDLSHMQEAVNDTLLALDVAEIGDADVTGLRAVARVMAWRQACAALVARYDFADPDGRYSRAQMLKGAQQRVIECERMAVEYLPSVMVAVISQASYSYDPYVPLSEAQIERLFSR